MYPTRELTQLALHKSALRRRIGVRRRELAEAAEVAERPIIWLDRVMAFWRRISPMAKLAAVPVALLLKRAFFPRRGLLGSVLRWAPALFSVGHAFSTLNCYPI